MGSVKFLGGWEFKNSDYGKNFFSECKRMCNDEALFQNFKQNPFFTTIIGNDVRNKATTDVFYKYLLESKELVRDIEKFKANDIYGNPNTYHYPELGTISSGTIYFLTILKDILTYFGDIRNFNVVEIGSGYGGQAKILLDYGVNYYTCIDEEAVLSLCKKYLTKLNHYNTRFYNLESIEVDSYDLVISNWCLSELDDAGIKFYLEHVISKCRYGYFLMNLWDKKRQNQVMSWFTKYFNCVDRLEDPFDTNKVGTWLLAVKNGL